MAEDQIKEIEQEIDSKVAEQKNSEEDFQIEITDAEEQKPEQKVEQE